MANLQTRPDLRIVRTEGGLLSGAGEGIRVYKGIPFAEAFVEQCRRCRRKRLAGDDRQAMARWPSPRKPLSVCCWVDEDCLTLNIWTPARAADEALPVMVWFYGGSFLFGSASDVRFDGEAL